MTLLLTAYTTTDTELYFLEKALGSVLSGFGMSTSFESRDDIDVLVDMVVSEFHL